MVTIPTAVGKRATSFLGLLLTLSMPHSAVRADTRDLVVEGLVEHLREEAALWVLTIGVSDYADGRISLDYADNDAVKLAQLLRTQQGKLFREVFTHVLVNEQATRENILQTMSRFLGQAAPGDVVLIFLAGHGLQDRQTGTYYFLPYNASMDNLVYAGLPMPSFDEACRRVRQNVDKLILLLDTCHAGAVTVAARGLDVGEDLSEALRQAEGQYVLSASKAGEISFEDKRYAFEGESDAHGAFTYSILRGLQGRAADDDGVVWISDLFSHVSKEVPRLTMGRQHPHSQMQGTNLPLFVVDEATQQAVSLPVEAATVSPAPVLTAPPTTGGRGRWWWVLVGIGAAGAAYGLSSGGDADGGPPTGTVAIDVELP